MITAAQHGQMVNVDIELTAAIDHLGNAVRPACALGLRAELLEVKKALERMHRKLTRLHDQHCEDADCRRVRIRAGSTQ